MLSLGHSFPIFAPNGRDWKHPCDACTSVVTPYCTRWIILERPWKIGMRSRKFGPYRSRFKPLYHIVRHSSILLFVTSREAIANSRGVIAIHRKATCTLSPLCPEWPRLAPTQFCKILLRIGFTHNLVTTLPRPC
jgi:hypothetical protein